MELWPLAKGTAERRLVDQKVQAEDADLAWPLEKNSDDDEF